MKNGWTMLWSGTMVTWARAPSLATSLSKDEARGRLKPLGTTVLMARAGISLGLFVLFRKTCRS